MTLTPRLVGELLRQRMNDPDGSKSARYINLIPEALKGTARKIAADPQLRDLLVTEKSTTTIALTAGAKVNLVTLYDTYFVLKEYFDLGQMYLLPVVTVLGSPATGTLTLAKQIEEGDTIVINGVTYTFSTELGALNIYFGSDPYVNAANIAAKLNVSADPLLTVASYTSDKAIVTITYNTNGAAGNTFTMVGFGGTVIASGATLAGGSSAVDTAADTITITLLARQFQNLDRVRFTTSGVLPSGLSLATDYYLVNYSVLNGVGIGQLSSTSDGLTLIDLTTAGSGVLTMTKMDPTGNPLQKLPNAKLANLPNYLDSDYVYSYIQADTLFVLPITTTGSVAFAVPTFSPTLSALPESDEVERMFLDKLYELVTGPGSDAAQDQEK